MECTKRVCYPTKKAAKQNIKVIRARMGKGFKQLSPYFCQEHQQWHLTSQSKNKVKHGRIEKGKTRNETL